MDDIELRGRVKKSLVKLGVIEDVTEGIVYRIMLDVEYDKFVMSQTMFTQTLALIIRYQKPLLLDLRLLTNQLLNDVQFTNKLKIKRMLHETSDVNKLSMIIQCGDKEYLMKTSSMTLIKRQEKETSDQYKTYLELEHFNYNQVKKAGLGECFPQIFAHGRLWYESKVSWECLVEELMGDTLYNINNLSHFVDAFKILKTIHSAGFALGNAQPRNFAVSSVLKKVKFVGMEHLTSLNATEDPKVKKFKKLVDLNQLLFYTPAIEAAMASIGSSSLLELNKRLSEIKKRLSPGFKDQFFWDLMFISSEEIISNPWVGNFKQFLTKSGKMITKMEGLNLDLVTNLLTDLNSLGQIIKYILIQLQRIKEKTEVLMDNYDVLILPNIAQSSSGQNQRLPMDTEKNPTHYLPPANMFRPPEYDERFAQTVQAVKIPGQPAQQNSDQSDSIEITPEEPRGVQYTQQVRGPSTVPPQPYQQPQQQAQQVPVQMRPIPLYPLPPDFVYNMLPADQLIQYGRVLYYFDKIPLIIQGQTVVFEPLKNTAGSILTDAYGHWIYWGNSFGRQYYWNSVKNFVDSDVQKVISHI